MCCQHYFSFKCYHHDHKGKVEEASLRVQCHCTSECTLKDITMGCLHTVLLRNHFYVDWMWVGVGVDDFRLCTNQSVPAPFLWHLTKSGCH